MTLSKMTRAPICVSCKHYDRAASRTKLSCKAFPAGIPTPILDGDFEHTKPYPGDHGIRFEKQE